MLRESMNSEKSNLVKLLEDLDVKVNCGLLSESDLNKKITNGRNKRQWIHGVMLDGNWTTNPSLIKQFFYDSFSSRFNEVLVARPRFESHKFKKISESEHLNLERPFEMPEVKKAVWDCGSEKSLGPDGFSFKFIKHYWELIGFRTLWRNWTRACLDSGFSSVLVNGSPTPEFKLSKGLRQGDPLSHILFIIAIKALHIAMLEAREKHIFQAIKALHIAMLEAREKHIFQGIKLGESDVTVSHPQFAYDAIFLGEWALCKVIKSLDLKKGDTVNFWKDYWFGDFNLASMFPRLYTLEIEKDSPLSERLLRVDGSQVWNWNWRRHLRSGRETTEFGQLTELVHDVKLSNLPYSWRWSLEKSGVKSLPSRIKKQMFQNHIHYTRWSKLVPNKNLSPRIKAPLEPFQFKCFEAVLFSSALIMWIARCSRINPNLAS
nr:RNA-directed DNA polymerase, eukaryota, reverse transcriptase zinc-binding domain protein [Tanacetum cinerariifolium]